MIPPNKVLKLQKSFRSREHVCSLLICIRNADFYAKIFRLTNFFENIYFFEHIDFRIQRYSHAKCTLRCAINGIKRKIYVIVRNICFQILSLTLHRILNQVSEIYLLVLFNILRMRSIYEIIISFRFIFYILFSNGFILIICT